MRAMYLMLASSVKSWMEWTHNMEWPHKLSEAGRIQFSVVVDEDLALLWKLLHALASYA